ncbi:ADP-ribosylation factor-like protein 16 isoform X2 [Rhinoderma darwinii]|uniref:ADP-ribosylation factor-like protein 16 isoform X2 n=1 Tax=Rhinoderma darwinii TaxID=43563 RepID=UPI003F67D6B3
MCLVLGPSGVGKTLLMKRLQKLCAKDSTDPGDVPPTQPTVGTNLTDLTIQRIRVTVREVGGSMVPIWPSYYNDCRTVLFIVDAANPNQISASCIQLLSMLSAPALSTVAVLVVFNKTDLPCCMSLMEMKSLFRLDDIIACRAFCVPVLFSSSYWWITFRFLV